MIYSIKNEHLEITVDTFGAQLISFKKDGQEYLWQRDPAIWEDSAPNIFPYVARLTDGKYTYAGKTYSMRIHGFIKYRELVLAEETADRLTFELRWDEETLAEYPWKFVYRISYILKGSTLSVETKIANEDDHTMYFGVGGHPGFIVPMEEGLSFEDYYLELSEAEEPVRLGFNEACFRTGEDTPYVLSDKKRIPLRHDLFDEDAIVLKDAGHTVRLGSDKGEKGLIFRWEFDYLGIWHMPKTEAPYVCIEPWSSLPARAGRTEDFAEQPDLRRLDAGTSGTYTWSVEIL